MTATAQPVTVRHPSTSIIGRVRPRAQWMVMAAALVVLAGVLVAWALGAAADRTAVVRVARAVRAGTPLTTADLAVVGVAHDGDVSGLVPAASLDELAGRVAAVDLVPGVLMQHGMWREAPALLQGEASVGAVLPVGRFPAGLAAGDFAQVVAVDARPGSALPTVRVIQADTDDDGRLVLTLAALQDDAPVVAQLAATDRLLLLGQPVVSAP